MTARDRGFATIMAAMALALLPCLNASAFRMAHSEATGCVTSAARVPCTAEATFAHWNTRDVRFHRNLGKHGGAEEAALRSALASWTDLGIFDLELDGATTASGFVRDGVNAMSWGSVPGCGKHCKSLTMLVLEDGERIVESDIVFNEKLVWTTNGTTPDLQAVATHEVGHSLGIHHTEYQGAPTPTMYKTYGGIKERTLEDDDRAALECSAKRYPVE